MSSFVKAELAATCSSLGRMHKNEYIIDPQCYASIRDIIRYLRRDDEYHEVRRYLGDAKVLQSDLIYIVTNSPPQSEELFDITVRLLVNLTNPVLLLYREEIPIEKVGRNLYMNLIAYSQEYKVAFCNIDFWKVICGKLTDLFDIDWAERSEDNGLQIERLLVLVRNVLQVPADVEFEKRPENDITIHDKVLWALRQSQLLELLLYISSNKEEEQYYLHLLEIFSLILREQNPKLLARCEIRRSNIEKEKDMSDLIEIRAREKQTQHKFKHGRNFNATFVLKDVKSISDNDVIYHKSLDKLNDLKLTQDKRRLKTPKNRFPGESERIERRSTFSVRLFLKEFCIEFLNCSYNTLMSVVKDKLVSGKGLSNDEYYYFWALKFFLEFNCTHNLDIKLISECLNIQTFHFLQTQMENCFEHLVSEKKKSAVWVRRIHLILKAYHSLLETLQWMDSSKDANIREISKVLKSQVFYVVEYREMMLYILFKYDPFKFSTSYLRDLLETTHLFLKLLEDFCKSSHIVVQKKVRKKGTKRAKKPEVVRETYDDKWEKIKGEVENLLRNSIDIPDIPPFDATLDIPIDDQKETAMKNIQRYLHEGKLRECIGLLRSSRNVWPENGFFGSEGLSVEDELMGLQEICITEMGNAYVEVVEETTVQEEDDDDEIGEEGGHLAEQGFELKDFIKRLVNKKVVEGCAIMLKNYKKNSTHTNHCAIKLLYRIGWECVSPSMMYQASLFLTLLTIMNDKTRDYKEINQFTKHLFRKFRENAQKNPKIYMELLFWKDPKTAYEIENGYGQSESSGKASSWSVEEEDELRRLWVECDQTLPDNQKIDWVKSNLINDSRSRIAVVKKLKQLWLIPQESKKRSKAKSGEWAEDETDQLRELFAEFRDAADVVTMIYDRLTLKRTKKDIRHKLVDLGLVNNLSELRKSRARKRGEFRSDDLINDETDSDSDDDKNERRPSQLSYSRKDVNSALKKVEHMQDALRWLKETIEEAVEDEDDSSDGYPLLALDAVQAEALQREDFLDLLKKLGLKEPLEQQVYWKVPTNNKIELHGKTELIQNAIEGKWEESDGPDEFDQLMEVESARANLKPTQDSDSDIDEFEKLRRMTGTSSDRTEPEILTGTSSGRGGINSRLSTDSDSENGTQDARKSNDDASKAPEKGNSMDSDTGDEDVPSSREKARRKTRNAIDSDASGDNGSSDEGKSKKPTGKSKPSKTDILGNVVDSEVSGDEEERDNDFRTKWKRRRCIGSDSEVEENGSGEEEYVRTEKFMKRPKMIDSDSDYEGNGSMDDDINRAR